MSDAPSTQAIPEIIALPSAPELLLEEAGTQATSLVWNERDQSLWWSDLAEGRLYRYEVKTEEKTVVYEGSPVGALIPQEDGTWVIFRGRDIIFLDYRHKNFVVPLLEKTRVDGDYFSQAIADSEGRILVGTVREGRPNGAGIYRLSQDRKLAKILGGTGYSAGLAWCLKGDALYWTCAITKTICRCRYDAASGMITNRQVFQECMPAEGTPDGLASDSEGTLWSARRDAGAILKIAASRRLMGQITFPVKHVTSLVFGGEDFKTVYVSGRNEGEPSKIFTVHSPVPGRPAQRSKIELP